MATLLLTPMNDILGYLAQFERYMLNIKGYDTCRANLKINSERFELSVNPDDEFQKKAEWNQRVAQGMIERTFDIQEHDFQSACGDIFDLLHKIPMRDERELRFSFNRLGRAIEGSEEFTSEIGKMFHLRIKAAFTEAKELLLSHSPSAFEDENDIPF